MKLYILFGVALMLNGCTSANQPVQAAKAEAPAKLSGSVVKEAELATLTLSAQAESRLGIKTVAVTSGGQQNWREFAGDVTLPPGRSLTVASPAAGTLQGNAAVGMVVQAGARLFTVAPLLPIPRDLRVTAEADLEQAKTRADTAKLRLARAEKMLKDDVGTVRAVEDARNELDLAGSAFNAAKARLDQIVKAPLEADVSIAVNAPQTGMIRQVLAAPGQTVNAGAPLFEIANLASLWIRVPVYAGEAPRAAAAQVTTMGGRSLGNAQAIAAPPTADPLAATVDLYFELVNSRGDLRPGEKVLVRLPSTEAATALQVPAAAILYDTNGGTWVYERTAEHKYTKRRVEVSRTVNGVAHLRRGPAPGAAVVTDGAAELWGTEFGTGK